VSAFEGITNAAGERLDHAFHPGDGANRELVVIGHGVTANKDRAFLVALAEMVAASGRSALRFSFSGNGDSQGRFEDSTITKEVADLGSVLDAASDWRVTYAGHSMGGAVGVLRASTDERIERLVSLAGMVHTAEFARRKFGDQTPGDSFMWDKPECPLTQDFMDDMHRIGSVLEKGREVRVPWLLVHGDADTVVPLTDTTEIASVADAARTEVVELPGADHLFDGAATEAMTRAVLDWLDRTPL